MYGCHLTNRAHTILIVESSKESTDGSASMHAIAAVPLFLIHETNLNATPKDLVHAEWKDHNDGYVGLRSGPGLGVEVDERNSSGYQKCHLSGSGQSTPGSRMARSPIIE